jgi:hypothetical protein
MTGSKVDKEGNFKWTYEKEDTTENGAGEFEQCLKEAWNLSTKHIGAELDNLDENTIEAILHKVRHEMDLIEEDGNIYDDVPKRSKNAYYKRAIAFMEKWNKRII